MFKIWSMVFLLVLLSGGAKAEEFDTSGLTKTQRLELQLQTEALRKTATKATTLQDVSEYAVVGKHVAGAIIATAGELGKTVDEVMNTLTGKIVIGVVIWKVVGQDILGVVVGVIWLMTMIPAWIYFFNRMCLDYSFEYHENGKLKQKVRRGKTSDGTVFAFVIIACAIAMVGLLSIF